MMMVALYQATAELDSYSASSLKQQSTGRYDDGRFVLDKHAELDSYSAGSLKQQSVGRYIASHYPDSEPTGICFSP